MILVDTSAWIEFLRDTGSAVCVRVDEVLGADLASCDPIRMELLAGARNDAHLRELRGLLARTALVPTNPIDYEDAHALPDLQTDRRHGPQADRLPDRRSRDPGGPPSPPRRFRLHRPRTPHSTPSRPSVAGSNSDECGGPSSSSVVYTGSTAARVSTWLIANGRRTEPGGLRT